MLSYLLASVQLSFDMQSYNIHVVFVWCFDAMIDTAFIYDTASKVLYVTEWIGDLSPAAVEPSDDCDCGCLCSTHHYQILLAILLRLAMLQLDAFQLLLLEL